MKNNDPSAVLSGTNNPPIANHNIPTIYNLPTTNHNISTINNPPTDNYSFLNLFTTTLNNFLKKKVRTKTDVNALVAMIASLLEFSLPKGDKKYLGYAKKMINRLTNTEIKDYDYCYLVYKKVLSTNLIFYASLDFDKIEKYNSMIKDNIQVSFVKDLEKKIIKKITKEGEYYYEED